MGIDSNDAPEDEEEGGEQDLDFWSDEGAARINDFMDEGAAYLSTGVCLSMDPEADLDEQGDYRHPDQQDPDEETLPPGEMELIFENSYIQ